MPKKKLSRAEGKRLIEEIKQRIKIQQENRAIARLEQLETEMCEKLGRLGMEPNEQETTPPPNGKDI